MAETPRIDRKEIKKEDLFVSKGRKLVEKMVRSRAKFLPIAVVIIITLAGVAVYQWWESRQLENGWSKLHVVMTTEEAKRWDELKKLHAELPNGRPKFFAATTLADHFYAEAKKEYAKDNKKTPPEAVNALEWYSKALDFSGLLPAEKQLLYLNKGAAYEIQNLWDQAAKEYQTGTEIATQYKALGLLQLARISELKGDKAKALEGFEKVSTDFGNTEYGKIARNHLRRLKSPFLGDSKS